MRRFIRPGPASAWCLIPPGIKLQKVPGRVLAKDLRQPGCAPVVGNTLGVQSRGDVVQGPIQGEGYVASLSSAFPSDKTHIRPAAFEPLSHGEVQFVTLTPEPQTREANDGPPNLLQPQNPAVKVPGLL